MMTIFHGLFSTPRDARGLNLFRALFCGLAALQVSLEGPHFSELHGVGVFNPIPIFSDWGIGRGPLWLYEWIQGLLILFLMAAAGGVATRFSLAASVALFFIYKGTLLSFTKSPHDDYVYHSKNIVIPVLCILACSPEIGRHGLLSGFRGIRGERADASPTFIPQWPFTLIKLCLAGAMFGAGYVKLVTSGPQWADGRTLQAILLHKWLIHDTDLAYWLASHFWICLLLGILTLLLEIFFPLVLFLRRAALMFVVTALTFHLSIWLTMQINFLRYFSLAYLIFLDWELLQKLFRRPACPRANSQAISNPAHPAPIPPYHRAFIAVVIGAVVLPIFLRIESWPLTDYRVFPSRHHFERVVVFRLKLLNHEGHRHWLEDAHIRGILELHQNEFALTRERHQRKQLLRDKFALLTPELTGRAASLELVRRRITKDANNSFQAVDEVVEVSHP